MYITKTETFKECVSCEEYLPPGHFIADGYGNFSELCRLCDARYTIEVHVPRPVADYASAIYGNLANRMHGSSRNNLMDLYARDFYGRGMRGSALHTMQVSSIDAALLELVELGLVVESNDQYHTVTNPALLKHPKR